MMIFLDTGRFDRIITNYGSSNKNWFLLVKRLRKHSIFDLEIDLLVPLSVMSLGLCTFIEIMHQSRLNKMNREAMKGLRKACQGFDC